MLKNEKKEMIEKYSWLEPDDERRNMSDREILDEYVDLEKSCLSDSEMRQVIDMLYKYKDTFSLRDEIGTCPNIEVEIDVTDKLLKEGFSAYPSPVMLISRKVTKHKRVITDFRHLNARIAKNNLAYPILKDTLSVIGSSMCKVLSVLHLKDAFHSLKLFKNSKRYCGILSYFGSTL